MTSSVWEWGPLSEAYQKTFVNDPTPRTYTIEDEATSHPIVAGTNGTLGISSIALHRPWPGAGAEFSLRYNSNTTSLLEFSIPPGTGSAEGVNASQYDGYTAAQAIEYGTGRVVYFDFSVLDFLPAVNASLAAQTHQGTTQGAIASELITRSIDWTAAGGTNHPPSVYGRSYGEVDIYNTGIYVRQYVESTASHAVHGNAHIRVLDPSGTTVFTGQKLGLGLYPGMNRLLYNWSYVPGGQLRSDGPYTVEADFVFTYPTYDQVHLERAVVAKNQGIGIPTATVSTGDLPTRLAGADRYATAAAISKATFAPGVPVVFVATASNFPDALATVPAAVVGRGPILLTAPTALPGATRNELLRLKPGKIVVVGGTGAVSAAVESQLAGYTTGAVVRVAGADRFSTAAAVSQYAFGGGAATVYIATAFRFPDALAGGPFAGRTPGPVLLTSQSALPAATVSEIRRLGVTKAVVLGGTAVVGPDVATELAGLGLSVSRIEGSDRYRTAAEVSQASNPGGASIVYVATAFSFPDALAGGVAPGSTAFLCFSLVRRCRDLLLRS
jgi:putative cell wall-binding protein